MQHLRKSIDVVLLRCRRSNADMSFSSLYFLRARPRSAGRWRASPGVEIHLDMMRETHVPLPAASGPHVSMRTGWLPEIFTVTEKRILVVYRNFGNFDTFGISLK